MSNDIIKADGRGLHLTTLEEYRAFAVCVAKSGLAPPGLNTPEKILVALQSGAELGMTPMQSLRSLAVINGTATLYGDAALAMVRRSGLLEWIEEYIEGSFSTNLDKVDPGVRAVCTVKRVGDPNPVTRSFSVAEAKLAGLWGKRGPWTTHPQRMLRYKARAFTLRDVFPDVLTGLHLYEEMQSEERVSVDTTDVTVSTQRLLETDSDARAERQPVGAVSQPQKETGQTRSGLSGAGHGDGSADVGRCVDQPEQGQSDQVHVDPTAAENSAAQRTAGDAGRAAGHPILTDLAATGQEPHTSAEAMDAAKQGVTEDAPAGDRDGGLFQARESLRWVCRKCGAGYVVRPARNQCVARDGDGFPCGGHVVKRDGHP